MKYPWPNISYDIGEHNTIKYSILIQKAKQLQNTVYSTTVECALFSSTTKEFKHENMISHHLTHYSTQTQCLITTHKLIMRWYLATA